MLMYLTGGDNSQRDWRLLEPRPGSLFVVGDEDELGSLLEQHLDSEA